MFNAPRRMGASNLASSAFIAPSGSIAPTFDPLASSTPNPGTYGEVDPWSAVPSPTRGGTPRRDSVEVSDGERFAGMRTEETVIQNAVLPPQGSASTGLAREGFNAFMNDPPALYLSLLDQLDPSTSGQLSLASVHRVLATSKLPAATVERIVNLTARDKAILTRQEFFCALGLVALAQSSVAGGDDDLEEVTIERLSANLNSLPLPRVSVPESSSTFTAPQRLPDTPGDATTSSPWDAAPPINGHVSSRHREPSGFSVNGRNNDDGYESTDKGYWQRLENVDVALVPEKEGWFTQKYKVESDKRAGVAVARRYSDFVWLLDCLVKRYPFRLLPALPPKKIGPDAIFLEQRRRALKRFINMIVNHPVMKDDGALNVFLTEPNFEAWRKRTKVSTDEESTSKKLNPAEEMSIPSDLSEKLGVLRDHLPALLGSYQKLVVIAERSLARLQAYSGDASRLALGLGTVMEEMPKCCFRCIPGGTPCSLCEGVARGLGAVGENWTRVADESDKQAAAILHSHIEILKTQRDLYVAFRDLFLRHDRLSKDTVESLRKKVESRIKKIETFRSAQKPGWEVEVDKLDAANDTDNSSINTLLSRRVFIKACMWHELAVVFHSRQAAQTTMGWRQFAREQHQSAGAMQNVWEELGERISSMPIE